MMAATGSGILGLLARVGFKWRGHYNHSSLTMNHNSPLEARARMAAWHDSPANRLSQTDYGSSGFPCPERQFSSGRRSAPVPGRHHLGRPAGMVFSRSPEIPLSAKLSPANMDAVRAPAVLRRQRRWVRSAFGGEFNAALVAPSSSAEGRNLAAGMERQPGRSAAVAQFGRVG